MKTTWILLLFILPAFAIDHIVINSRNWEDVYTGMMYAEFLGKDASFIIEESHGLLLQDTIPRTKKDILLIESSTEPFLKNFRVNLESRGFNVEELIAHDDFNTVVANLVDPKGYVIINSLFSYNGVAVAPFAGLKDYYVIFANSGNIDDIYPVVSGKEIILYGYLDREVRERLSPLNPGIINEGDKFSNNLALIKMFLDDTDAKQLILADGTFLEPQFFSGSFPVLFIGKTNLPDKVLQFVQQSGITHGVLIGYDNFGNAMSLKNKAGLKILVKFAKGINQKQYALDMFSLPQPKYSIGISSVNYNKLTKKLEVAYKNLVQYPTFIKTSHNLLSGGAVVTSVGDDSPFIMGSSETKTVAYDADLSRFNDVKITSDVVYGGDTQELEYLSNFKMDVGMVSLEDNSRIELVSTLYNKPTKRFNIVLRNTGKEKAYAKPEIDSILINEKKETLVGEQAMMLPGEKKTFKIKATLSDADIEDNPTIDLAVWYGAREDALVLLLLKKVEMKVTYLTQETRIIMYSGIALACAALVAIFLLKRRKKEEYVPRPRR